MMNCAVVKNYNALWFRIKGELQGPKLRVLSSVATAIADVFEKINIP
jgi:hypothetical protein